MITVIGIGIEAGDISQRAKKEIKCADEVYSRGKTRQASTPLSEMFADCVSYEELNKKIVDFLLQREASGARIAFLSVGDGFSDSAVKQLSQITDVKIVPGVADGRARHPSESFITLSAYDVQDVVAIDTRLPLTVYQIDDKFVASDVKLELLKYYPEDCEITLVSGKEKTVIPLVELDRQKICMGSTVFIPQSTVLTAKKRFGYTDLIYIMQRLTAPDGCPWDRAQTHKSVAINMLEEAYEAVDAINRDDADNLKEELGDVMLQSVFQASMSEKEGDFDINDVINDLCVKLVSRHTHIFGENKATNADEALDFWEKAKAKEKHYSTLDEQLCRLPDTFPADMLLHKFARKANKAGAGIKPEYLANVIKANADKSDRDSMEKMLAAAVMLTALYDMPAEELMLTAYGKLKETANKEDVGEAVKEIL